jgi:copper chaperone CopZ
MNFTIMQKSITYAAIFFSLITLIFSCSTDNSVPNTVSEFKVTGMSCAHGCGGSIRKGLYEKEYTTQVDVDFNDETGLGNIAVYHNNKSVTAEQIKELIEGLNEGQFEVEFIGSKEYSPELNNGTLNESSSSKEEALVEAKEGLITFPNITDLLNNLIH